MFFLIKQCAPYIPALKCRALRRFFGNAVYYTQELLPKNCLGRLFAGLENAVEQLTLGVQICGVGCLS